MNSSIIQKSFAELGLSDIEAAIYMMLLNDINTSITDISKQLNTNRVKIYSALDSLEEFGLLKKGPKYSKVTELEPPSRLVAMLKHKNIKTQSLSKDLEEILPELMLSYEYLDKNPKVKIYEGVGQMTRLLLQQLEEVEKETLWLNEGEDLNDIFGADYFYTEFSQKRAAKGVQVRILANTNNITIKKFQHQEDSELRKVKFLPIQYQTPGTITIYNNKIILWNTHIPRAVVISDKQITQVQRDIFNTLWSIL